MASRNLRSSCPGSLRLDLAASNTSRTVNQSRSVIPVSMSGSPDAGHAVIRTKLDSGICQKRIAGIPSTRPSITVVIFLLRSGESSESMANHDSEIMVWLCSCRSDAGSSGVGTEGCERSDAAVVRAGANGGECRLFLDGLLSEEQRETGWMRSEAAGDAGPWRQQELLGRDPWNADALRDVVGEYVVEHLRDDDAVLVIDETGFLKQGKASCGVARQYTGSAGKITNCQIGVFATYVARHGHAFIDRALYLPKSWADDPLRLKATYVPNDIGFATKPRLAMWMIARAVASGVPFSWVAADSVYGVGEIEGDLRRLGKGYVLGVASAHVFRSWGKKRLFAGTAAEIVKTLDPSDWQRLSAGEGTKGPRLHDWCYL